MKKLISKIGALIANPSRSRKLATYLLLIIVPLGIYWRWLGFRIFSYGDWNYRYLTNLKEYLHVSSWASNLNLGAFNDTIWRMPYDMLLGLFALFGMGMNISEEFMVFLPIALTSMVAPYTLLKELFHNTKAALMGALFYATNTYFLAINPQGHQLLTLAGNILTLFLGVFIKALHNRRRSYFVASALLLWLAGIIDFRLFYIGAFLTASLLLYRRFIATPKEKLPAKDLLLFTVVVGLSEFSWIATFARAQSLGAGTTLDNSLFGDKFWNLSSALALHHPFWNGTTTTWFIVNQVPFYFWLVPIGAVTGFLLWRKQNKYLTYFALVAVVGILLSKQVSQPFSGIYPFLYAHLPGFNAFRESTKFYYLIVLGYTVLISALFVGLQSALKGYRNLNNKVYYGAAATLVLLCLVNIMPYVTGSMQKLLTPRAIPSDYSIISDYMTRKDSSNYYRTLWVPTAPRWSYFTNDRPRISASALTNLPHGNRDTKQDNAPAEQIDDIISSSMFEKYLNATSTKYVFVPLRDTNNQDDFFKQYGDDRQFFIDQLDKVSSLKRINIGTKDVIVYENKSFGGYINATNWLLGLGDSQNIESLSQFATKNLGTGLDFAVGQKSNTPSTTINDPLDTISSNNMDIGSLKTNLKTPQKSTIYVDTNRQNISYSISGGVLNLIATNNTLPIINGSTVAPSASSERVLTSTQIDPSLQYYLKMNGRLTSINLRMSQGSFGIATDTPEIIVGGSTNLIQNGSFEDGLWQKNVEDCSPYDGHSAITMDMDKNKSDGKQSLRLMTSNHIACTHSSPAMVQPGAQYILSFDYAAPYGDRISYGISYEGGPMKTFSKKLTSGSEQWRTLQTLITIPQNAHQLTLQLRGLPLSSYNYNNQVVVTNFDNVKLTAVTSDINSNLDADAQYQKIQASSPNSTVTYNDKAITRTNLIQNGSFEDGLWQKNVEDCDMLDQRNSVISMQSSSARTDGRHSLQLSARTHAACTGPGLTSVDGNSDYLLSFDYQSPDAKTASYSISFNDADKTVISGSLSATKSWNTFSRVVEIPLGATQFSLKVYARSEADGRQITDRYDNFKLFQIPNISRQVYVITQFADLNKPQSIKFKNDSDTKKTITIHGAKTAFYLTMGEQYDRGWSLTLAGSGGVVKSHFEVNGYMNGWYVDLFALCSTHSSSCKRQANGSYDLDLVVSYTPQSWFVAGTCLSGTTIVLGTGYLGYSLLLKRRSLKSSKEDMKDAR